MSHRGGERAERQAKESAAKLLNALNNRISRLFSALQEALAGREDYPLIYRLPDELDRDERHRIRNELRERYPDHRVWWSDSGERRWVAGPETVGAYLAHLEANRERMAADMAEEVARCAQALVDPTMLSAVLARWEKLARRWPLPGTVLDPPRILLALPNVEVEGETCGWNIIRGWADWPNEAAPVLVARWARPVLNQVIPGHGGSPAWGDEVLELAEHEGPFGDRIYCSKRWPGSGIALLYLAEREVDRARREPRIAIDAGRPHHALVSGLRDQPKASPTDLASTVEIPGVRDGDRLELRRKGERGRVQLALPLQQDEALHAVAVLALKEAVQWEGLRHWAAILRLLSVEGGRRGWVRWTMSDHLAALRYSERRQRDPETLAAIARTVELFTLLELVLYSRDGKVRHRAPLLHVGEKFDVLEGSSYRLDGMELRINDWLYQGVRDSESGDLGRNWFPAPIELAQIDHRRHPHAIALGLLLPMRWRWQAGDSCDHLPLQGSNLLAMAGIRRSARKPGEAWARLERDLDKLCQIGLLATWRWDEGEPSDAGICRLYPALPLADVALGRVRPIENPALIDLPLTGPELRAWRRARSLSQRALAQQLGISQPTLSRIEASPGEVPGEVREAIAQAVRDSP